MMAVCCMTMRVDTNLEVWIHHHLHNVGMDYIFLRIEGALKPLPSDRVLILEHEIVNDAHIDSIPRQQERQKRFVNQCLRVHAPRMHVRYLLHIDDDELLVLHKQWSSLKEVLQQQPQDMAYIRIQNYEAVLLSPPLMPETQYSNNLFWSTTYFKDGATEECRGYRNGKSIALVGHTQECTGPHTFTGPWIKMNTAHAIILHYESLFFRQWLQKFTHLSQCSSQILQQTLHPFPFYQQSILQIQKNKPLPLLYDFWRQWISRVERPIDVSQDYTTPRKHSKR